MHLFAHYLLFVHNFLLYKQIIVIMLSVLRVLFKRVNNHKSIQTMESSLIKTKLFKYTPR